MKLLIVEDNARVRRMIRSIVGALADEIFECPDGSLAVAAYERLQPDWIAMDFMMNEMDGLSATRNIKARWPAARIVIVTNYDAADLRAAAEAAGACAYVTKENLLALRDVLAPKSEASGAQKRTADPQAPES